MAESGSDGLREGVENGAARGKLCPQGLANERLAIAEVTIDERLVAAGPARDVLDPHALLATFGELCGGGREDPGPRVR